MFSWHLSHISSNKDPSLLFTSQALQRCPSEQEPELKMTSYTQHECRIYSMLASVHKIKAAVA